MSTLATATVTTVAAATTRQSVTTDTTQPALLVLYQAMRQADSVGGLDMLIGAASYLCRTRQEVM